MARSRNHPSRRAIGLGFAVALAVLGLFVWVIGITDVVDALLAARLWVLPLVLLAAILWLLTWSLSLHVVLTLLGVEHTERVAFATYLGIVFTNNVTPFSQAGAEPLAALFVSRVVNTRYEVSLSAVASVDALNVLPSIGLAILSLVYFGLNATLNPRIEIAAVFFLGGVGLVALLALLAWRHRNSLESALRRGAGTLDRRVARSERVTALLGSVDLTARVAGFGESLAQIASDPRALWSALAYSTIGWLCLVSALWLSLFAVGYVTPFEVSMLVVPLALLAGFTPLPGGVGGIEAASIFLLSSLTTVPIAAVTAAVLLFRAGTYLLPVVAGGTSLAVLGVFGTQS